MKYWEPEGFHQMGKGEYEEITTADVLDRMKEATGTKSDMALAEWLGTKQAWISDARRRNIVPVRWLQIIVLKHSDYAPPWILSGKGDKFWSGYKFTSAGLRGLQEGYYILPDPADKK